jgi:hypothetical protein
MIGILALPNSLIPHSNSFAFRHQPTAATARVKGSLLLSAALWLAVLPAGAATNFWTGAGADQNWSTGGNWTNNAPPLPADDVYFSGYGPAGTSGPSGTPNNIVNTNMTVESLWYTNNPSGGTYTTLINPGVTLTITGALANALFVGTTTDIAGNPSVNATIQGPGATLVVANTNGTISVRQAAVNSSASATLDLRGLDTLQASVRQVLAAGENVGKNVATMYFALTNYITCYASGTTAGLIVGNNNTSGSKTANSFLGTTNVIFCDGGLEVPQKRMTST